MRFADYICDVFGQEGRIGTCGHPEIELALVELYRLCRERESSLPAETGAGVLRAGRGTGGDRYLKQAQLFIERRGQTPPVLGDSPYHQDHAPFRSLTEVVGHAVRMVYYCCGAADVAAETGDPEYLAALERLWQNMVYRRMYVTGGIGSRYEGEAFGEDFELPNERAYAESCAAIGSVMWNWRMLQLTGEARFADVLENALYNGMLPGLSLDGERYFYQNPLADNGKHRRTPWFECSCCPPNIARMLASLPAYLCSQTERGLWLHLYAESTVELDLSGRTFRLRQETDYPWDRIVTLTLETEPEGELSLHLRIPGWCEAPILSLNGVAMEADLSSGSYAEVRRTWKAGDVLRLVLPMPVVRVKSHPHVTANAARVALRRGPLIYCVEQTDLEFDPCDLVLPEENVLTAAWEPNLLGGVVVLRGEALCRQPHRDWNASLYQPASEPRASSDREVDLIAIPYYTWANRDPGGMAVWIRQGA